MFRFFGKTKKSCSRVSRDQCSDRLRRHAQRRQRQQRADARAVLALGAVEVDRAVVAVQQDAEKRAVGRAAGVRRGQLFIDLREDRGEIRVAAQARAALRQARQRRQRVVFRAGHSAVRLARALRRVAEIDDVAQAIFAPQPLDVGVAGAGEPRAAQQAPGLDAPAVRGGDAAQVPGVQNAVKCDPHGLKPPFLPHPSPAPAPPRSCRASGPSAPPPRSARPRRPGTGRRPRCPSRS